MGKIKVQSVRQAQDKDSTNSIMAKLLSKAKASFIAPKKGDVLKGTITKLTSSEILVDVNAKSEAIVLEKDKNILRNILSSLKVGDSVFVSVLNPESDSGNPVVSLRKFIGDILWKKLENEQKNQTPIEAFIKESTKAGFVADTPFGLSGFLPNSQTSQEEQISAGKKISVYILDIDRQEKKVILSQKKTVTKDEFDKVIKGLKIGQKVDAIVSNIANFGVFTILQFDGVKLDGLVHISEISWEKVDPLKLSEEFSQGQKIEAIVINFDKESKRVSLSIKKLTKDPFEEIINSLSLDEKVKGKVLKIIATGLLVSLEPQNQELAKIEAVIKKEKVPPTVTYSEGDMITATIESIDKEKHRVTLVPVLQAKPIGYR